MVLNQGLSAASRILPIIDQVLEESAAAKAGLIAGDEIIEINGSEILDFVNQKKIEIVAR